MTTHTLAPALEEFEKLAVLRRAFEQDGDETNTRKTTEMMRKIKEADLILGFCGHFSAGKSTMINRIVGADLLPANPIPTTANLARIHSGDSAYARIYFQNDTPIEFPYPYDLDEIGGFAVDGKVHSIEISHPIRDFGPGITLLDTPGIDSTDEAHRIATESALHLADVIFYVTDYNHVLSEMNVSFLKQLRRQKKRIVLVVNQVDKHSAAEVDFDDYRQGIYDAFSAQDIELEKIFYTSLKTPNHPKNEFPELRKSIQSLIDKKEQLIIENAETAARQLIQEHINWKTDKQEDQRERLEESLNGMALKDHEALLTEHHELERQLQEQQEKPEQFFETARTELNKALDSAILMPYDTREAGRSYLESVQPDFKVGLLASKKKTEQEQQKRLLEFYQKATETASALDWQVKEALIKEIEAFGIQDEAYKQSIYDLQVHIEEKLFANQIQSGATFNADYVLRYTNKVAEAIKHLYRREATEKLEEARDILEQDAAETVKNNQALLEEMDEKIAVVKELQEMADTKEKEFEQLHAILSGRFDDTELTAALAAFPEQTEQPAFKKIKTVKSEKPADQHPAAEKLKEAEEPETPASNDFKQRLEKTAEQLKQTSLQISAIKGLQSTAKEMMERAARLEESRFTVALFGAFSAGKSSFANALIGESVLPVSPNPTTATINKISPVDDEHPHKTAAVQYKREQEILEDVREALKSSGKTIRQLHELPDVLKDLEATGTQISFLQAVSSGLNEVEETLGSLQTVDLHTFYEIVANETKAVFVESIELFYDCPLTQQGITLVDTPGADSINARHTGVAFNYIKNADAILFVTYYNHAFSRADREFLIQLGRVKDSFAMDKMFFVVNAADLAASTGELGTVVGYVEKNLISYGIRQPRIYPISSKQALDGKQANRPSKEEQKHETLFQSSGMAKFERDFMRFTMDELTNIAVEAAHTDFNRVVRTLDSFIASAREDENVRLKKREAALQEKQEIETLVLHTSMASEKRALTQEIDQLVYYVQQRVFLRYLDLFKETFNPSVLSDSAKNKKSALNDCLKELLALIGFDLAQEMRATALRIEKYLGTSWSGIYAKMEDRIKQLANDYTFSAYETPSFATPEFEKALTDLDPADFNKSLGLYKNPKQFFEKNGRMEMREQLLEELRGPVSEYLEAGGERLTERYMEAFEEEINRLKESLLQQAEEYTEGKLAALSTDVDGDQLEQTKKRIRQFWD